jgi:hypothetical protein
MLNRDALADLYRTWRKDRILSVYLDGRAHDFSERKLWRKRMEHAVQDARKVLNGTAPDEVDAFNQSLRKVEEELAGFDQFLPDRGWVAFATPEKVVHSQSIRVPMPDLVRWEDGIRVAPYVRALKQDRLVVVALVDSRRARVFEYRDASLSEVDDLLWDAAGGDDLTSINVSKRATSHSGVRGKTGTDAAQRSLDVETDRLVKRVTDVIVERAGSSGLVVVGGTPEPAGATIQHLPAAVRTRTIERTSESTLEMSDAQVTEMLEGAASELNQRLQSTLLDEVIDLARSGGRGALTPRDVEPALREARVDTLLVSRSFIKGNPDYADKLVGAAFEQSAEVEELSQDGAARLDVEGQGVAARLRYVVES